MSEAVIVANTRKKASQLGLRLFRNNRGQFYTMDKKRIVRAGLEANGSSDLIGIMPVVITPEMVGETFGLFLAVECKEPGWKGSAKISNDMTLLDDHEQEQANFITQIRKLGGIGFFLKDAEDLEIMIEAQISQKKPLTDV